MIVKTLSGKVYFEVIIAGKPYVFTLETIPEHQRPWLNEVLEHLITDAYNSGQRDERNRIKKNLKPLKDLLQ